MALHFTSSWVAALHLLLDFLRPFIQDTLRVCWWYTGKITWPVTSREYGLLGMKLVPKEHETRLEKNWNWNLIHRQCVYFWLPLRQLQKVPHSYAFKMKNDRRLDNPDQRIQEDHPKIFEDYKYLAFGWMCEWWFFQLLRFHRFYLFHYTGHWAFRCLFLWPDFWIVGRSHPIRNLQWPGSKSLGSLDDLFAHIAFQFSNWKLQPLLTLAICVKKAAVLSNTYLMPERFSLYFRLGQLH